MKLFLYVLAVLILFPLSSYLAFVFTRGMKESLDLVFILPLFILIFIILMAVASYLIEKQMKK
ncbi:hypothetical protein [Aneurinibacillus uraniidurans]|uniref:hypothetical protein n=1 Tax=Aneurinibacillus uraniidurans TaxID=2966586 RepID=UPI00234A89F2|nr:hypothetical protein [Aneurinibacillus sp. B1]WCN39423.1 hypothetical protein PO771_08545 [Aneurinibacillus sp. B1]